MPAPSTPQYLPSGPSTSCLSPPARRSSHSRPSGASPTPPSPSSSVKTQPVLSSPSATRSEFASASRLSTLANFRRLAGMRSWSTSSSWRSSGKRWPWLLSEALGVGGERLERALAHGLPLLPAMPGAGAVGRKPGAHRPQPLHRLGTGRRRRASGASQRRTVGGRAAGARHASGRHRGRAQGGFE